MGSEFKVKQDNVKAITQALKELKNTHVYVGVPEANSSRQGEQITNAELVFIHTNGVRNRQMRADMSDSLNNGTPYSKALQMYIHANGSPMYDVPPRPIIEPAIEDSKEYISDLISKAGTALLSGDTQGTKKYLKLAGMLGARASQQWFTSHKNNWASNSPATIKAKGSDKPLIDTGNLRKSITYVIKEGE